LSQYFFFEVRFSFFVLLNEKRRGKIAHAVFLAMPENHQGLAFASDL
jgi:hypothetical protein